MVFEWDASKAASNLEKHGVSFEEAVDLFDEAEAIHIDVTREAHGERRWMAIGPLGARVFSVVYTRRADGVRIISARRAHPKEIRAWRK